MSCLLNNAIKIAINKLYSQDVKLKDEQFCAVESVLRGKDVLAVLPTGFKWQVANISNIARCIRLYVGKFTFERKMCWFVDFGRVAVKCTNVRSNYKGPFHLISTPPPLRMKSVKC